MSNCSRANFCYLSNDVVVLVKAGISKNHFAPCHHFAPLLPTCRIVVGPVRLCEEATIKPVSHQKKSLANLYHTGKK